MPDPVLSNCVDTGSLSFSRSSAPLGRAQSCVQASYLLEFQGTYGSPEMRKPFSRVDPVSPMATLSSIDLLFQ